MTTPNNSGKPEENTITSADELLIQRCLDNELSPASTRQLMSRLDMVTDGWKTLACGFLEERLYKHAISHFTLPATSGGAADLSEKPDTDPAKPQTLQATVPLMTANRTVAKGLAAKPDGVTSLGTDHVTARAGVELDVSQTVASTVTRSKSEFGGEQSSPGSAVRWWAHPVTSISLCAAIAFVGGLLVPDLKISGTSPLAGSGLRGSGQSGEENGVVSAADPNHGARHQTGTARGSMVGDGSFVSPASRGNYSLQILPTENANARPLQIPVVDDPVEWSRGFSGEPTLPAGIRPGGLRAGDQRSIDSVRWIRIPMDDENDILMIVRDRDLYAPAQ